MKDKNGVDIVAGHTLYNTHDKNERYLVLTDDEGRLFLGDFDSPLFRYSPSEFWEVVDD